MTELARLNAIVSGHVQGVNFRVAARRQAQALGLAGWVRNRHDSSVEVVAEGPRVQLQQFLAWLNEGPPGARVRDVRATWADAEGEWSSFTVRF